MRQRKVKNLEEKFLNHLTYFVNVSFEFKGKWKDTFRNENELYLEIGVGKGDFLIQQAERHHDRNYVGIEGRRSILLRALQKLENSGLSNVRFAGGFIWHPTEMFAESEVAGIYLNFSDPWPKAAHSKRRLTHRNYLMAYHEILKPGGFVELKTDSGGLFDFTVMEVDEAASELFRIEEITTDLHSSEYTAKDVKSEYEMKFIEMGKKICYMRLVRL